MGAAESIFYEDDEPLPPHSSQQNHPHRPLPPSSHGQSSQHGPRIAARRPKRRTRPPPGAEGIVLPGKLLNGLVLGLPDSGKRTLLERLKGRDPFAEGQPQVRLPLPPGTPEPFDPPVVVPYQPPAGSAIWDRLQIKVQVASTIPNNTSRSTIEESETNIPIPQSPPRVDFAVVMVNPKDDPGRVQAYLTQTITDLLRLYYESNANNIQPNNTNESNEKEAIATATGVLRPFCMCFLVNFRDLQHSSKKRNTGIQESEVKQCVIGILQQNADILPSNDQLLLQFGTTSLYNCYGLGTLHQFMYNTYLQSKRNELQQQLMEVHEEMTRSHETMSAPKMKYKEFLKIVVSDDAETQKSNSHMEAMNNHSTSPHSSQQQQQLQGNGHPERNSNSESVQPKRRNIVPQAKEPPPAQQAPPEAAFNSKNTKNALEAFFASDDEEEVNLVKKSNQRKKANHASDDDDSDDDFFYDDAGERCSVHDNGKKAVESTQSMAKGSAARSSEQPASDDDNQQVATDSDRIDQRIANTVEVVADSTSASVANVDEEETPEKNELENVSVPQPPPESAASLDEESSKPGAATTKDETLDNVVPENVEREKADHSVAEAPSSEIALPGDKRAAESTDEIGDDEKEREQPTTGEEHGSASSSKETVSDHDEARQNGAAETLGDESDRDDDGAKKAKNEACVSGNDIKEESKDSIKNAPVVLQQPLVFDSDDSDDGEFFVAEAATGTAKGSDSDSDDDDDFFLGEESVEKSGSIGKARSESSDEGNVAVKALESGEEETQGQAVDKKTVSRNNLPPPGNISLTTSQAEPAQPPPSASSLSSAAQAAIAAAQKEAELMLRAAAAAPVDKSIKKEKKKKKESSKEKKKEKKAKKEKRKEKDSP